MFKITLIRRLNTLQVIDSFKLATCHHGGYNESFNELEREHTKKKERKKKKFLVSLQFPVAMSLNSVSSKVIAEARQKGPLVLHLTVNLSKGK